MQKIYPHSKLPNVATTIFATIGQLAHQHGAVNLSQGYPDFGVAPELLRLVSKAMNEGHNQYAPMQGIFTLRETISEKIERLYGHHYHPENEMTITAGATQALFTAISAFVKKGDEVIVPQPAYDCYEPAIELYGGKVVPLSLKGTDFAFDFDGLKKALSPKTRMLIINTPHNPSGSILSKEDMRKLEQLLKDTNIIVLSDEVYEHIVFDEQNHESAAKYPELAKRSIICSSFGKTFHVTGWKMGYCVAPKELMREFQKVHQYNVFSVNHPIQRALDTYLKNAGRYEELGVFYQQKRDYFLKTIAASRFTFAPSSGTYFQLLDYSAISDEPDIVFAERLIKEFKLASIPVSVFYRNGSEARHLRFCFAKTQETLDRGAEIMMKI
ncbi:methionine aminotransferase [Allomuricauda sp. SCSIO 65647]|uniref:methionine aminotransferase n=1 Tax=Allomuricauda sp. SCSIO 65647 TaxID=2908843 RepID=UPI0028BECC40|nr:methionine aminotransferase [Muricauda sp. SCSIO 65647]